MRRIERIQEISDAAALYTGRKIGNLYWMANELKAYIDEKKLCRLPARCGVALALTEENRDQFCFQTGADCADSFDCDFDGGRRYVAELIFPAASAEKCDQERRILARLGFSLCGEVQMMSAKAVGPRPDAPVPAGYSMIRARIGDGPAIEALYQQAFDIATDNPPLGELLERDIEEGKIRLLIAPDGGVAGCVTRDARGRSEWIRHVVIDRERRGAGLGKRLMTLAMREIPENTEIRLWVMLDNLSAIRLYEGMGFARGRLAMEIWKRG